MLAGAVPGSRATKGTAAALRTYTRREPFGIGDGFAAVLSRPAET